ncbi:MAG: MFS transporter, partial [Deltaproteobacteria bacterium]|nr:MFS transporter [Deltaproteobacteria bacterium]
SSVLWRHADFVRLWAAQAISAFGSRITRTALPIIAVGTLREPETVIGVLTAMQLAPGMVVGLVVGGMVDRGRKRRILIAADLFRAFAVLTLTLAWLLGVLSIVHVILVGALVGAASAVFQITDNAYLPALIGKKQLAEGNAKLETTEAIAEIGGPASAGVLIAALGAPLVIVVDALTYLWSAAMLARIRTPDTIAEVSPDGPAQHGLLDDLRVGLRTIFRTPIVRPIVIAHAMWSISGGFFMALYTVFCLRTLHLSEAALGVIIGLGGIGALGGALLSRLFVRWFGLGVTLLVTSTLSVACALLIPLADGSFLRTVSLLGAHQVLSDGFSIAFVIQAVSLRQTLIPKQLLGRANAAIHVCSGGLLALGAVGSGLLADATTPRFAVWVGVLIGLLVPFLLLPLVRLREMPRSPDDSHH